jgi:tetratricopeptide (TPR) repeat protein
MVRHRLLLLAALAVALVPGSTVRAAGEPAAKATGAPSAEREPIFAGLGNEHYRISTSSPLAQRYFDQGLALVFAFNHDEAVRSFKQAAALDPNCAMAYWGTALALGPNINLPEDAEREKEAYEAIRKARSLDANASGEERAFIGALAKRYAPDGNMTTAQQESYAAAMRELAHRFPDDPDAQALFAESLMDLHPWRLWTRDGKPAPGTEEVVATLEHGLEKHPDHTGLNHYYIHTVEASQHPERALAAAERIAKLAPAAGHLVHMPAHIYFRIGRYDASVNANVAAIKADQKYIAERHPAGVYPMMYYPHNIQFLWASYMMEGNRKGAVDATRELQNAVSPAMLRGTPFEEFLAPPPLFTEARFSEWDAILAEPAPPADLPFTTGVWHYARGLAFAAKGQGDAAAREQQALDAIVAATPPDRMVGENAAKALLEIAAETLAGERASRAGDGASAITHLRKAVATQDGLNYEEPPAWYYPVRETLGNELLAQGKYADGESAFRADLAQYPENGWSLHGLMLALRAQKKDTEAVAVERRFRSAWAYADVKLADSGAPAETAASR